MDTLRRVLVALGGLISLALAGLTAACLVNHALAAQILDFLDRCVLYNLQLCFLESQRLWLPVVIGLCLLLLACLLLLVAFYRVRRHPRVRVETEDGTVVEISLAAVDNVVRRAAGSVPQVRGLNSRLYMSGDGLHVLLNIVVPAGAAIPGVGAAVRDAVASELLNLVGVQPREISVEVGNVTDRGEEVARVGS